MGTRTDAYFSHPLACATPGQTASLPQALERVCSGAMEVDAYWRQVDPHYSQRSPRKTTWDEEAGMVFNGPGSLLVRFLPRVACVHASARWSGFLTIEPLRAVHRRAVLQLAAACRSPSVVWVADYADEVFEVAYEGADLDAVCGALKQRWGAPQASLDDSDRQPPAVWFTDVVPSSPGAPHLLRGVPGLAPRFGNVPSAVVELAAAFADGQACHFALHDALLEAGHPDLAAHFRDANTPHPKGCWALDLLLGKE